MFRTLTRRALSATVAEHAQAVSITPRAWARVAAVNRMEKADPLRPLRMSIIPGGCQGFSYQFEFEKQPLENDDIVFENTEVKLDDAVTASRVVLDTESIKKLQGATIDYVSELRGSAFVCIGNELVDQACACAASFSLRGSK